MLGDDGCQGGAPKTPGKEAKSLSPGALPVGCQRHHQGLGLGHLHPLSGRWLKSWLFCASWLLPLNQWVCPCSLSITLPLKEINLQRKRDGGDQIATPEDKPDSKTLWVGGQNSGPSKNTARTYAYIRCPAGRDAGCHSADLGLGRAALVPHSGGGGVTGPISWADTKHQ